MQKAIKQLYDWVIDIAERTVVNVLETCNVDRNKAFIHAALKGA